MSPANNVEVIVGEQSGRVEVGNVVSAEQNALYNNKERRSKWV